MPNPSLPDHVSIATETVPPKTTFEQYADVKRIWQLSAHPDAYYHGATHSGAVPAWLNSVESANPGFEALL